MARRLFRSRSATVAPTPAACRHPTRRPRLDAQDGRAPLHRRRFRPAVSSVGRASAVGSLPPAKRRRRGAEIEDCSIAHALEPSGPPPRRRRRGPAAAWRCLCIRAIGRPSPPALHSATSRARALAANTPLAESKRGRGSVPRRPVARTRGRGKAGTSDRSATATDADDAARLAAGDKRVSSPAGRSGPLIADSRAHATPCSTCAMPTQLIGWPGATWRVSCGQRRAWTWLKPIVRRGRDRARSRRVFRRRSTRQPPVARSTKPIVRRRAR